MTTQNHFAGVQANLSSPPFVVSVLDLNPGDSRLISPSLDQAVGNSIDLDSFSGDARARMEPWPLIAKGQRVWLTAHGRDLEGDDLREVIFDGDVITASMLVEGPSRLLSRQWLVNIANRSELRLEGKVSFKGENEAGAIEFRPRRYKVQGSRSFYLEAFEECSLGRHNPLQSDYFRTTHFVDVLQGAPGHGIAGKYVAGPYTENTPYFYADLINAAGRTFPSRKIRFSCLPVNLAFVYVYDVDKQRIYDAVVTSEQGRYTVTSSTDIYRIIITPPIGPGYLYVDNFELYPDG